VSSPLPLVHRIFQAFLFAFLALVCGIAGAQTVVPGYDSGTFLTGFPDGFDYASRVVFQPDGKYIVVGQAWFGNEQFAMTRFNADGTIDTSYGANHIGTQLEPIGSGNAEGYAAAFDSNGRLVVAGHTLGTDNRDRFAIARFNVDGTLDLSFGGGGSEIALGTGNAGGTTLAIQSTGRILVGGYSTGSGGHRVFTVLAYTPNDVVDTTYGSGGSYVAADSGNDLYVNAMALLANDKVLIAGGSGTNMIVQRLNADGSLDTTFGTNGTATIANGGQAGGISIYSDGRIGVAGGWTDSSSSHLNVVRLSADGVLDTTYGTSGLASISNNTNNGLYAHGLIILSDGSAVVGANSPNPVQNRVLIARFTPTGSIDTTFGTGGTGQTIFAGNGEANPRDLVARPGGGYFVPGQGFAAVTSESDSMVVAFNAAGQLDTTFNGTGFTMTDVGHRPAVANASALQSDGKLVAVGRICTPNICSTGPNSLDKSVVVRYLASGALDTSFGTGGSVTITGMFNATAIAIDSSQRIVVGGVGLSTFNGGPKPSMAFARLTSSGTMDSAFNGGSTLVVQANNADEEVAAIALQGSGRIVGAGFVKPSAWKDSAFVGITSAGALDTTFGSGGETIVPTSTGDDQITALAFDAAGNIVGGGWTQVNASDNGFAAVRLGPNGALDTTFGSPNGYVQVPFPADAQGFGIAIQGNNILLAGRAFSTSSHTDDFALARLTSTGALDTTFNGTGQETDDVGNNTNVLYALTILPGGKILAAGQNSGFFAIAQFLGNGGLDTTFGTAGVTTLRANFMAGADSVRSLSVANNTAYMAGNASNAFGTAIVALGSGSGAPVNASINVTSTPNPSTSGQGVTITATLSGSAGTPTGTVTFNDGGTAIGSCSSVALSGGSAQCAISSLAAGTHSITATYSGDASYNAGTSGAITQTVNAPASGALALAPASLNFGGESMSTTSPAQTITVTNTGSSTVNVSGVAVTSQFAQSNTCASLAAGASCTISITFSPAIAGGALNSTVAVTGTLTVTSDASGSPNTAALSGTAEKSLVAHYYRSILRRAPDQGGHDFWQSEAARVAGLGANVNEVWYAMAMSFFGSQEYANFNTDNAGYLTDIYNTFFNRAPDSDGFNFWMGQMQQGMPRESVLVQFLFSTEFANFTQAIFGNTAVRPEMDMTMDMYRGILQRLPDSSGYQFFLGQFQNAQCTSAQAVRDEANTVSQQFFSSPEYNALNRTNAQFMSDIYNAIMRRGADLDGIKFWIGQLDSGAQTREQVRAQFVQSPEFSNRVTNVVNAGCTH
jgi:uncharacterized delta-60 repeat protein